MKIAITGGKGFIGTILTRHFLNEGHECRILDYQQNLLTRLLQHRFFMPVRTTDLNSLATKLSRLLWRVQRKIGTQADRMGLIQAAGLDITGQRETWTKHFEGCDAVIHLAAIPHPNVPGMNETDFERINYEGAVNIFEAAAAAGVQRFLFSSSGQVYNINRNRAWKRFPIHEDDADDYQQSETIHIYGKLKWKFERYLMQHSPVKGLRSFALRLEFPGVWGASSRNLFNQTSIENLNQAFTRCLEADLAAGAYIMNIADGAIPPTLGSVRTHLTEQWPEVPCSLEPNQPTLCIDRARKLIGYQPEAEGHYYHQGTVF